MLSVGIIGGLAFLVGIILVGLSGSQARAATWFGPAGAALAVAGLGIELVGALGS